jgi:2-oxoglutarate dehydrogenase complex dehydrogenase (E1) component-like enzyme
MRLIEKEMLSAINNGRNWSKANTRVSVNTVDGTTYTKVYLHDHLIACTGMWKGSLAVETCKDTLREWPTRTTMSRLRALGVAVCTRKGEVMLNGVAL